MELIKDNTFWKGKNVLVTGHTGFKGVWLCSWLQRMGAKVTGIALEPNTNPSLFNLIHFSNTISSFIWDIREPLGLAKIIQQVHIQIIFKILKEIKKNKTIIFITHKNINKKYFDKIIKIENYKFKLIKCIS